MKNKFFIFFILCFIVLSTNKALSLPKNNCYIQWGFGLGIPYTTFLMDGLEGGPFLNPPFNLHFYVYKTLSLNWLLGLGLEYTDQNYPKKRITTNISEIHDDTEMGLTRFNIQFHYAFNEIGQGFFLNGGIGKGSLSLYKGDIDKAAGFREVNSESALFFKGGVGYAFKREEVPLNKHWFFVLGLEWNYAHALSSKHKWKTIFSNLYLSWFY